MKRLYQFSLPQSVFASQPLNFAEVDGGFETEMMIFSTAFNRNKAYFQVSDLMKWQNKLDSIMFNFNHDLNLSGGKYLGNQNKFTSIRADYSTGELEIFATFKTTDPTVVARKSEITAPSIELMVEEEDSICGENGEYFRSFDWVGCALLLGLIAGSGNARVGQIKEFSILQHFNIANDMTKEEVQALLEAQKSELLATFEANTTAIKKEFGEVVAQSQSVEESTYEWVDEETGNKYRCTRKEMSNSVTELVEKGTMPTMLMSLMKSKGVKFNTDPEPEPKLEPTAEELEDSQVLADVQMNLKNAEKRQKILAKFKAEKLVSDRESDAPKTVVSPEFAFNQSILNN